MKKVIIAVALALIIVVLLGYLTVKKPENKQISPAIDAVPVDVSFFFQIYDLYDFLRDFQKENKFAQALLQTGQSFDKFKEYYNNALTVLETYPKIKSSLENREIIAAVRRLGKLDVDLLLIVPFSKRQDLKDFDYALTKALVDNQIKPEESEYNGQKIFSFKANNKTYYFTFINNLFLFSASELFIQNSLRQLINSNSLQTIPEFSKVALSSGNNSKVSLFVNYQNLRYAFINSLSQAGFSKISKLAKFANWGGYDLTYDDQYIRLYGYTSVYAKVDKYLKIFYGLDPVDFYVDKILPAQTYEYTVFGISSYKDFLTNYINYLTNLDLKENYLLNLKKFKRQYGFDPSIRLLNTIGQTITVAKAKKSSVQKDHYSYFIMEVNSVPEMKRFLFAIIDKDAQDKGKSPKSYVAKYKTPANSYVNIYKLPDSNLFSYLFGSLTKLPKQKYCFFIDKYLIVSSNKDAVKFFIDSYSTDDRLFNNKEYKDFRVNINPKINLLFYSKQPFVNHNFEYYFKGNGLKTYKNNYNLFAGINNFAAEFYFSEDVFISYILFNFNPNSSRNKVVWSRKLEAPVVTKPFIFINHNTGEKEIFVGDKKGNIYLLTRNGDILWQRNIGEPITGNIYMIDYYQNHKYQLLFNTKSKVYIIDRLKRDVENFPIVAPSKISTSISVFDYKKDGNYRIFIPSEDKMVYLYNKKGKPNPQWLITNVTAPLTQPVQHFVYKGKDYIVFADDIHTYILDRRGETRIDVKKTFAKAPNTAYYFIGKDSKHKLAMFVTTTKSGKLAFIDLYGNVYIVRTPENFSSSHYFTMADIDADGLKEFIYAEDKKLYIFKESGNKIIKSAEFTANGDIISNLTLYNFGTGKIETGFVTDKNLIYLIDKTGTLHKGFPKSGTTQFTITQLVPGQPFNVIVGNGDYLVAYQL